MALQDNHAFEWPITKNFNLLSAFVHISCSRDHYKSNLNSACIVLCCVVSCCVVLNCVVLVCVCVCVCGRAQICTALETRNHLHLTWEPAYLLLLPLLPFFKGSTKLECLSVTRCQLSAPELGLSCKIALRACAACLTSG